jgi:energy-coupling factor transporter ATP-binding protein EcfA2
LHKPSSLLPIARHRENLLYLIETYPVTIVVGQTGSGKTTQIPQYLEQAGWCSDGKIIAVTQVTTQSIPWFVSSGIPLTLPSLVELQQPLLQSESQKKLAVK